MLTNIQIMYTHFSLKKKRPPPFSHKAIMSVAILSTPKKRLSFEGIRLYFTYQFVYYQKQESNVLSCSLRACLKQDHFQLYECRCPASTGREEGVCGFSDQDIWKVRLPEVMLEVAHDEVSKAIGVPLERHRQKNKTNQVVQDKNDANEHTLDREKNHKSAKSPSFSLFSSTTSTTQWWGPSHPLVRENNPKSAKSSSFSRISSSSTTQWYGPSCSRQINGCSTKPSELVKDKSVTNDHPPVDRERNVLSVKSPICTREPKIPFLCSSTVEGDPSSSHSQTNGCSAKPLELVQDESVTNDHPVDRERKVLSASSSICNREPKIPILCSSTVQGDPSSSHSQTNGCSAKPLELVQAKCVSNDHPYVRDWNMQSAKSLNISPLLSSRTVQLEPYIQTNGFTAKPLEPITETCASALTSQPEEGGREYNVKSNSSANDDKSRMLRSITINPSCDGSLLSNPIEPIAETNTKTLNSQHEGGQRKYNVIRNSYVNDGKSKILTSIKINPSCDGILPSNPIESAVLDSPLEPDLDTHVTMEPVIIPLDYLTDATSGILDYTNTPWPDPRPQPPLVLTPAPTVPTRVQFPPLPITTWWERYTLTPAYATGGATPHAVDLSKPDQDRSATLPVGRKRSSVAVSSQIARPNPCGSERLSTLRKRNRPSSSCDTIMDTSKKPTKPAKARSAKPLNNCSIRRECSSIKVNIKKGKPKASRPKKLPSLRKNIQPCDTNKTVLSENPSKPAKSRSAKPLNNCSIHRGCSSIKVNIKKGKPNASRPKKLPSRSKNIQPCDTNKTVLSENPSKKATDEESSLPCEVKNYTRPSYSFCGFAKVDPYLVLAMKINKEAIEALERENENQETLISTAEETLVLKPDNIISAENQISRWRGWEKPRTKRLERMRRIVHEMGLTMELEQCGQQPEVQVKALSVNEMINNQKLTDSKKSPEDLSEFIQSQLANLFQGIKYSSGEPPFSFTVLIIMALMSTPKRRLSLREIQHFIQYKFPFYRNTQSQWMDSVHSTLKWNKVFMKKCSSTCQSGATMDHEGCWRVDPWTASEILTRAFSLKQYWSSLPARKILQESNVLDCNFPQETEESCGALIEKAADSKINVISDEKCTSTESNSFIYTPVVVWNQNLLETKRDCLEASIVLEENTISESSGETVIIKESQTHKRKLDIADKSVEDPKISSENLLQFKKPCYHCSSCEEQLSCHFLFKCHIRTVHLNKNVCPCYLCHKNFLSVHILWLHMYENHPDQENTHADSSLCLERVSL